MKKTLTLVLALTAVLFAVCSCGKANGNLSGSVFAGNGTGTYLTQTYLKIDAIGGESTDSAHTGWIDVLDFEFGFDHPDDATGINQVYKPFTILHKVDIATPALEKLVGSDQVIKSMTLEMAKTIVGKECIVLSIAFTNLSAVRSEISVDYNGDLIEAVEFIFGSAELTRSVYDEYGHLTKTVTESYVGFKN